MEKNLQIETHKKRLAKLSDQRKRVMAMPAEKALEAIIDSPQAIPLVHSFPEQDFHLLINDIGMEDALPLLSMASNKQWEHILDQEVWERDRIQYDAVTKWLGLLLQADPRRLINWLSTDNIHFLELYLFNNIEIKKRVHDQDPADLGPNFVTFDDVYYFRMLDRTPVPPTESASEKENEKLRFEILSRMLSLIAENDFTLYHHILLESSSIIPAESEEEIYRLRNVRLAEKGFLPFDEATGIYQPVSSFETESIKKKGISKKAAKGTVLSAPLYPVAMIGQDNFFSTALKIIDTQEILQHIQLEFAGLCNQIVTADQKTIQEKEELSHIVKKACGYINIGIQHLTENETPAPNQTAAIIERFPLSHIFRIGFEQALKQKWRAEKWHKTSWFADSGLSLAFWDEKWMGVLGGLLIKKPLFFDNYKTGVLYREFASVADVNDTRQILSEIIAFDNLLSLISVKPKKGRESFLTYKNLIFTLWARDFLGLPEVQDGPPPLTLNEFKGFFDKIFTRKKQASVKFKEIDISVKTAFLDWLSGRTGLTDYEITEKMGSTLEDLFSEMENEYKEVSPKDLDPRYISLFFVK